MQVSRRNKLTGSRSLVLTGSAQIVTLALAGCPHFEAQTQVSQKGEAYSNEGIRTNRGLR